VEPADVLLGRRTGASALGFGCSALIGARTFAESTRLLEAAYEAGVRHFDVARSYGTGDAERVLGRFAMRRRDEVTIATKFGIFPARDSTSLNVAKRIIRPALRRSHVLLGVARRNARRTVRSGRFTPDDAVQSLAMSLERLGSPYVDALLLHACTPEDWGQKELLDVLEQCVSDGRVRVYGTATSFAETTALLAAGPAPDVIQFDSDVLSGNAERVTGALGTGTAITYGCLSRSLPRIGRRLAAEPSLRAQWSRTLDVDLRSPDELPSLLLAHAAMTNRCGITLFSAGSPERVQRTVAAVAEARYDTTQLRQFARLARSLDLTA
jgi:aryl-alcohol dehydrogenase-like predicted oxidoreductase